jgi:single-stranded DNA-binding protein
MAFYLNQYQVMGNLVADPEIKDAGKSKVCKFRIAVNNPHNETALFFYVDVWGKEGEKCMLLKKGSQVFITNASVIPKQYKKTMSNGEEISCNSVTINVDGYCGKVQFGPKVDQQVEDSPKPKRGRPKKQKKSEELVDEPASSSSDEVKEVGESDSFSEFDPDFEF